jgi:hypothetical protein
METNSIQWEVIYKDGTVIKQYENDIKRRYEDIDRTQLMSFSLLKDDKKIISFYFEPNQKLIYRKRVIQPAGKEPLEVYLCGWQQNVGGETVQSIAYVLPDGQVIMMGAWRGDDVVFGKVELLNIEL